MQTPSNAQKQRSGKLTSLVLTLSTWLLLPLFAAAGWLGNDSSYYNLLAPSAMLALLSSIGAYAQSRGKHWLASWLVITGILLANLAFNLLVSGTAIIFGVISIFISILVAWQTLPGRQTLVAGLVSILGSLAGYALDIFLPEHLRIAASPLLQQSLIIIGGLAILILSINLLRHFAFESINAQIRSAVIVTTLIPILVVALPLVVSAISVTTLQANDNLARTAREVSRELDDLLEENAEELQDETILPAVINYLKNPQNSSSNLASTLASRNPDILSYAILDASGNNLQDSRAENQGKYEGFKSYYLTAALESTLYISEVMHNEQGETVFYISTPVKNELGRMLGLLRVEYDAKILQEITQRANMSLEQNTEIIIIDQDNIIISHSAAPELIQKSIIPLEKSRASYLQNQNRLPNNLNAADLSANLPGLAQALQTNPGDLNFSAVTNPGNPSPLTISTTSLRTKEWRILVGIAPKVFLAPVYAQIITIGVVVILVMLAVVFSSGMVSGLLSEPINLLAAAAQRIVQGEEHISLRLERKDEIGLLSEVLQSTNAKREEALQTLESNVEDRTAELRIANEKNNRRASQFEAIAQITRAVTSISNQEDLLPQITQSISKAFGFYHVGIFLVDEKKEYAVLRAANSAGGQKMLQRQHRLRVGQQGIVGYVANTGQPRIALDVGDDAVFFTNPDLPATRSEIALPLRYGDVIIGALDVQSVEASAFSADDIDTLLLLSDQISIAIENSRLYEETSLALKELKRVYSETVGTSLQGILREKTASGYRYAKGSVETIYQRPSAPGAEANPPAHENLQIPITLRGEKLGNLSIRQAGRARAWGEAEVRMYQAIADRMSFALENARLFADARRRANYERMVSEASNKLSATVQFETILRTAAEEISKILDGSEVLVQIQPDLTTTPEENNRL